MKAAIVDRYGPPHVVRVAEVPIPVPGTRKSSSASSPRP